MEASGLTALLEHSLQGSMPVAYGTVFLGGILASCTPCVYPMIPITAGVIGSQLGSDRLSNRVWASLVYVLGLALTYAALGAVASLTGQVFGQWNASPWVYFTVANIFLLFGLSTLEVFYFEMPLASRISSMRWGGGLLATFAMGVMAGLVAGPCTAPIMGVLLVFIGLKQNVVFGVTLLFTFALGMSLLLLVAGIFTGALSLLPRSGAWMVKVKKASGWLMIAAAEYFLIKAGNLW